jgi:hypothetical protein
MPCWTHLLSGCSQLLLDTLEQDAKGVPDLADRLLQLINMAAAGYGQGSAGGPAMPRCRASAATRWTWWTRRRAPVLRHVRDHADANLPRCNGPDLPRRQGHQGTMSQQAYKLFAGVTPETLEQFKDAGPGQGMRPRTRHSRSS